MPKYSFIVPTHNDEESLLKRNIDSLINQTYKGDYEVLLIDDGSKPEYANNCDKLQSEKVRVIHKENGGVTTARNRGIKEAAGEWIIFIDSDDYCLKETLESIESLIEQHKDQQLDMVYFNTLRIKLNSELRQKCLSKEDGDILSDKEIHNLLLDNIAQGYKERTVPFGCIEVWGKACRLGFLKKNSLLFHEDLKIAEDLVFNAECLRCSPKTAYKDKFLYICQEREESTVKKYHSDIRENDKNYIKYLNMIGKDLDPSEFNTALTQRLIQCTLGVIGYDMAHPNNPKSFKERLSDLKEFVRSEPYKTAIKTINLSWVRPKKSKLKVLLLRFRLEWLYLKIINKL